MFTFQEIVLKMSYFANFNNEAGKTILGDIIKTCNHPENSKRLSEAKASAGKEMLQMMHLVFPQVIQIQIDIIKNYGFPGNREGLIQFEQLIRDLEKDDPKLLVFVLKFAQYICHQLISTQQKTFLYECFDVENLSALECFCKGHEKPKQLECSSSQIGNYSKKISKLKNITWF